MSQNGPDGLGNVPKRIRYRDDLKMAKGDVVKKMSQNGPDGLENLSKIIRFRDELKMAKSDVAEKCPKMVTMAPET